MNPPEAIALDPWDGDETVYDVFALDQTIYYQSEGTNSAGSTRSEVLVVVAGVTPP